MESKILLVLAVVAVAAALFNTLVTFEKVGEITGLVAGDTSIAHANLTINTLASINFTTSSVEFGNGTVGQGKTQAFLDTKTGTVVDGNWTANTKGLILYNIGNVDVSLDVAAGKDKDTFIGGTSPAYKWMFSENASGSCATLTTTSFTDITANSNVSVCSNFSHYQNKNSLRIDFNITVPSDAAAGFKTDTITAAATAI